MTNGLTVGYIGLGLMGKSIARNILKAGFPLVVHNRSREAVQELVSAGAQEAWSAAEVAEAVDAGSVPITLGRRTLRADAAALIALTLLLHAWGDL